jgi:hypothetical protein
MSLTLYRLSSATLPALTRLARWEGVELPRRRVTDSDERYRQRVANHIYMALVMSELAWTELDRQRAEDETAGQAR